MAFSFTTEIKRGKTGSSSLNAWFSSFRTALVSAFAEKRDITGNAYTVAELPAAGENEGNFVYCSDGADGDPCAAVSNGTIWRRVTLGDEVAGSST